MGRITECERYSISAFVRINQGKRYFETRTQSIEFFITALKVLVVENLVRNQWRLVTMKTGFTYFDWSRRTLCSVSVSNSRISIYSTCHCSFCFGCICVTPQSLYNNLKLLFILINNTHDRFCKIYNGWYIMKHMLYTYTKQLLWNE